MAQYGLLDPRSLVIAIFTCTTAICVLLSIPGDPPSRAADLLTFTGSSDASAAVALDDQHIIVGDDENNVLRIHRLGQAAPVATRDISELLQLSPEHPEADLEGCTRVGERIYWITSHGRNKSGKNRPNRYRFFATTVPAASDLQGLKLVGAPCSVLAQALATSPALQDLDLRMAMHLDGPEPSKKLRQLLAPKEQGLNIEGLAASHDGRILYIGLRNPRPLSDSGVPQAVVIPLTNAADVVDKQAPAEFGPPLLWDLGGYGVRAMEYSPQHKTFYFIAGPHTGDRGGVLMGWSGVASDPPSKIRLIPPERTGFAVESIVVFPDVSRILLISDDGSLPVKVDSAVECSDDLARDGTCENKLLVDPNRRTFRALWHDPADPHPLINLPKP